MSDDLAARAIVRDGKPVVALRYVGAKASKADTIGGSRVTWKAPGDVQEVPLASAKKLLRFPEVWALPEVPWAPPTVPVTPADLLTLLEAGAWDAVQIQAPDLFAKALSWFRVHGAEPQLELATPRKTTRRTGDESLS